MIKDTQKQNDVPTADNFDRYLMYVDNPALGVDAKTRHYEIERNRTPQRLIDNRRVLAGIGLSLVKGLTEVGAVLQFRNR